MTILAAVKVLGDLCLLLCAASAVGCWTGTASALLLPPLLCALGVALGCGGRHLLLRLPAAALPLLGLLWATDTPRLIVTAAMAAYTLLVIAKNRGSLEHGAYRDYFARGAMLVGAVLLFSLLFGVWQKPLLFGCLYGLAGIYLMRQLRLGRRQSWQSQLLNLAALLTAAAAGAALLGTVLALSRLGFVLAWLWDKVANVLMAALMVVIMVFDWLFQALSAQLALLGLKEEQAGGKMETAPNVNNSPYFEAVETDPTVFYVLLALAGAALAFLLVRRAMAQMVRSEKQHGRAATLEKLESPAAAMPRFAPGSPRERVRQSYRKFMRLLENRGAQLKEAQTTGEIHCENRHLTQEEAAGQLRELYLSARYDPNAQITSQQVRQARALVKEIESTPPG